MKYTAFMVVIVLCPALVESFRLVMSPSRPQIAMRHAKNLQDRFVEGAAAVAVLMVSTAGMAVAEDGGASLSSNSKIRNGGASTIVNQVLVVCPASVIPCS